MLPPIDLVLTAELFRDGGSLGASFLCADGSDYCLFFKLDQFVSSTPRNGSGGAIFRPLLCIGDTAWRFPFLGLMPRSSSAKCARWREAMTKESGLTRCWKLSPTAAACHRASATFPPRIRHVSPCFDRAGQWLVARPNGFRSDRTIEPCQTDTKSPKLDESRIQASRSEAKLPHLNSSASITLFGEDPIIGQE